ncbi:MAG: hypothetical protein GXP57_05635 [Deltaproteobacteria bacterium]|nr:hypothetical protein [Deltaproteobacteria bacterium]
MRLQRYWLAALVLFLILRGTAVADVVDRVVAIVNNDVITLSEVNEEGKPLFQRIAEQVPAAELQAALQQARRSVIQKLIEKKIMQEEAKKKHITVSDDEVNKAIERILARNHTTMKQLKIQLAAMGMTEKQYRENLRSQILSSKLINYEIRSKIIVPEDKILDYYDTHYTKHIGEGDYYILQIGCSWKKDLGAAELKAAKAAARKKIEHVRSLAVAGQDFKELARQYSDLPSAADGGDIGIFKKDEMAPYMRDAVTSIKPGEISRICETPDGYQIFKVLSSKEGKIITKAPFKSVKDDIYQTLYQQEMQVRLKQWLTKMQNQAYIKIL